MKRSRIIAAVLAFVITASIFALPSFIRGVDSLFDMGTFYFFVIDETPPQKAVPARSPAPAPAPAPAKK